MALPLGNPVPVSKQHRYLILYFSCPAGKIMILANHNEACNTCWLRTGCELLLLVCIGKTSHHLRPRACPFPSCRRRNWGCLQCLFVLEVLIMCIEPSGWSSSSLFLYPSYISTRSCDPVLASLSEAVLFPMQASILGLISQTCPAPTFTLVNTGRVFVVRVRLRCPSPRPREFPTCP